MKRLDTVKLVKEISREQIGPPKRTQSIEDKRDKGREKVQDDPSSPVSRNIPTQLNF